MFHHTHAYLAAQIYENDNPLIQLGAILPDIASTGIISGNEGLHGVEYDQKFKEFILAKYPDYKDLSNGVHAHNIVDDISHLEYKGKIGFAYQNNKELSALIETFYQLDQEHSKNIAHVYIESGVDIFILKDMPEIQTKLRLAINQIDKQKVSKILSEYFRKDPAKFYEALTNFLELFTKYNFTEHEKWNPFWHDLEKIMKLKNIGEGKRMQLLNKSMEITKYSHKEFMTYVKAVGPSKL